MSATFMFDELQRNLPGNPNWEGSFYEQLTEHAVWDVDAFWQLHLYLVQSAAAQSGSGLVNRDLALAIVTLQGKVMTLVSAHYDANDVFKIRNIHPETLHSFVERFQHAMLAVISGEVLPESSYDLVNPLLVHA